MDLVDFLDLVSDKKGKKCIVETTAGVFEGIYLRQNVNEGLQMVIRPTGKTKEMLEHVAIPEMPEKDLSKECAIPISKITRIEFIS